MDFRSLLMLLPNNMVKQLSTFIYLYKFILKLGYFTERSSNLGVPSVNVDGRFI